VKAFHLIILLLILAAAAPDDARALSLKPGNYEITHWIELPGGGSSKLESEQEYFDGTGIPTKMTSVEGCERVSEHIDGNILTYELKCKSSPIEKISGRFTFKGDSFEGTLIYLDKRGENMRVGMRGKRIGDSPESSPMPTSSEKLDQIDQLLRKKWAEMIAYIRTGDFDKALVLFHPYVRKKQAEIFQVLKSEWPQIVDTQVDFRRKSIDDQRGFAFYELVTREKDGRFAYTVYFQKDQNDNWFIVEF
jgi:hypothetical protein